MATKKAETKQATTKRKAGRPKKEEMPIVKRTKHENEVVERDIYYFMENDKELQSRTNHIKELVEHGREMNTKQLLNVWDIGKELYEIHSSDLVHGEWISYCKKILEMSVQYADKLKGISKNLSRDEVEQRYPHMGVDALDKIATLPIPKEERDNLTLVVTDKKGNEMEKHLWDMTTRELGKLRKYLNHLKGIQQKEVLQLEDSKLTRDEIENVPATRNDQESQAETTQETQSNTEAPSRHEVGNSEKRLAEMVDKLQEIYGEYADLLQDETMEGNEVSENEYLNLYTNVARLLGGLGKKCYPQNKVYGRMKL